MISNEEIGLKLKSIIDTAIDGILTIDANGLVEDMNKSAASLFQYHPDEVIGNNIKMLMPEPYHSEHDGYLHRYNTTKKARIIGIGRVVQGKKKDNSVFTFRLEVSEVILHNRIIFVGIIHDLTQVKIAEQKLIEANLSLEKKVEDRTQEIETIVNHLLETNKKLEKSENELKTLLQKEVELGELKSRFISLASHEFRTPLSTILSSAALIGKYTETSNDDKRQRHVGRIKNAVVHLTGILNDFLSLGKLEEGKVNVKKTEINISNLLEECRVELKNILKQNQTIECNIEGTVTLLQSDPTIIKNILFNLISNAIKYSKENGVIQCNCIFKKQEIIIQIIDNGIGIPLKEQKNLFERFFRASNAENIQGTGLGLNIVQKYVSLIKGTIAFESIPNIETKFTVKIPLIE